MTETTNTTKPTGAGGPAAATQLVVDVSQLTVELGDPDRGHGVRIGPVDLQIGRGECVCVVGTSGAGKSTIGQALLGMLGPGGRVTGGSVRVAGTSLFEADDKTLRSLRGSTVTMIFQDPTSALNPVRRLDKIFADVLKAHGTTGRDEIAARTREALTAAELDPDAAMRRYAHELSGGMRQRVMVALALVNRPAVIVADEPTTALDPTTQKEVIELFGVLKRTNTLVVITHDLRVARRLADRIVVMSLGRIVETGTVEEIMTAPRHPVTQGLVANQKLTKVVKRRDRS
ncbi:ABC transporter ATP-binding protein [Dactylosporangium sp. CA-152071]|uniref:ABC transporter ATP-binding protein n=1 Tax=Dactylosporangium sp. CA-152071 TaxID=3239933 RepID=UPI003D9091CA